MVEKASYASTALTKSVDKFPICHAERSEVSLPPQLRPFGRNQRSLRVTQFWTLLKPCLCVLDYFSCPAA